MANVCRGSDRFFPIFQKSNLSIRLWRRKKNERRRPRTRKREADCAFWEPKFSFLFWKKKLAFFFSFPRIEETKIFKFVSNSFQSIAFIWDSILFEIFPNENEKKKKLNFYSYHIDSRMNFFPLHNFFFHWCSHSVTMLMIAFA